MKYPQFLKYGDRIGYIAPSFGCSYDPYLSCFQKAQETFSNLGYQNVLGPNCYKCDGIGKSTDAISCGKEINDFFLQDKSDIIFSVGGGETMCEDLSHVDFNAIKRAVPKWYIGYSDNTNLTFTLPTLCDIAAVYAPCAPSFGMQPWHKSLHDTMEFLKGNQLSFHNYDAWEIQSLKDTDHPYEPYHCTEPFHMVSYPQMNASFRGRLIGGCMDVLSVLCGTKFDHVSSFLQKYQENGFIWFLEACDLSPIAVRRVLWQLDEAGWFQNVKGFLIGRPYHYGEECFGINQQKAITSILAKYNVPILMDLDIGHLPPMIPMICGAYASITTNENTFSIQYELK